MDKVSIIIPTFNCAQYVATAIESCLKQTHENIEVIIVDDGSTDNTYEAVKPYEAMGSIRYLYQKNKGLPGARNAGIRESKGDFIVVLDADDELDRKMITLCLERVEQEKTDWCLMDILRIEESDSRRRAEVHKTVIPRENVFYGILAEDFIRRAPFFRKKSLLEVGLYDEEMLIREDWDINIRMIFAGKPVSYVPEPLYIYKIRSNSLIKSKYRKKYDFTLKLLRKHHKRLADGGDKEVSMIYARKLWRLGEAYLTDVSAIGACISCILESMRYEFSIRRLLHPFYFHVAKRFGSMSESGRNR